MIAPPDDFPQGQQGLVMQHVSVAAAYQDPSTNLPCSPGYFIYSTNEYVAFKKKIKKKLTAQVRDEWGGAQIGEKKFRKRQHLNFEAIDDPPRNLLILERLSSPSTSPTGGAA